VFWRLTKLTAFCYKSIYSFVISLIFIVSCSLSALLWYWWGVKLRNWRRCTVTVQVEVPVPTIDVKCDLMAFSLMTVMMLRMFWMTFLYGNAFLADYCGLLDSNCWQFRAETKLRHVNTYLDLTCRCCSTHTFPSYASLLSLAVLCSKISTACEMWVRPTYSPSWYCLYPVQGIKKLALHFSSTADSCINLGISPRRSVAAVNQPNIYHLSPINQRHAVVAAPSHAVRRRAERVSSAGFIMKKCAATLNLRP
jgi:hypothetical protein